MWKFNFRSQSRVSGLRGKWSPYGKVQLRKWKQLLAVIVAVVRNCLTVKGKHSVNLFGEKGLKEGIVDAVRKYGKMDITAEDIRFLSTSICQSCYLVVKGIDEKIRKFAKKVPYLNL